METDETENQPESVTDDAPAAPSDSEKQSFTPEPNNEPKSARPETIYKALAIKLKKELVKCREELKKVNEDSSLECNNLRQQVEELKAELTSERQNNVIQTSTLEAQVKTLKSKLQSTETDHQSLQVEFEEYKVRASKIMQQTSFTPANTNNIFEEERYKHMKELNDEQAKRAASLEKELSTSLKLNKELEAKTVLLQTQLETLREQLQSIGSLEIKCENLKRENENLIIALKQYRLKLKEPATSEGSPHQTTDCASQTCAEGLLVNLPTKQECDNSRIKSEEKETVEHTVKKASQQPDEQIDDSQSRLSPSTSIKDESRTNSSSSVDGSTSGYVHIKPNTFEIISRSSVLEDAQNQIDNLTRAYLDSESTNSLLTEQVAALKDEIRRMQRGAARMDLAENLEYLKNILFKFLSLDAGQIEQRQRLIPVISTILKLSPEETQKLGASAVSGDRSSMASSFFNIIH